MMSKKPALLVPVENQVRELDAKLLLACVAARRGLPSIIGPQAGSGISDCIFSKKHISFEITADR